MIKFRVIISILAVTFLILAVFYFGYQKYYPSQPTELPLRGAESQIEKPSEITKPESEKPAGEIKPIVSTAIMGYKLYKNTDFGFEIQYPDSWIVDQEINENVRGEMVKEFFFKKPNSDLRFAILPRDGLSYGVGAKGTSTPVFIGGSSGMQTQYILKDGRRLWLLFPRYGLNNWLEDLGRIDIMTSVEDTTGDTQIFEKMLNSFKLSNS
ncbi:MAG: hypothetical protein AAB958_03065 [Patescibacteria group bacterium]